MGNKNSSRVSRGSKKSSVSILFNNYKDTPYISLEVTDEIFDSNFEISSHEKKYYYLIQNVSIKERVYSGNTGEYRIEHFNIPFHKINNTHLVDINKDNYELELEMINGDKFYFLNGKLHNPSYLTVKHSPTHPAITLYNKKGELIYEAFYEEGVLIDQVFYNDIGTLYINIFGFEFGKGKMKKKDKKPPLPPPYKV